MQPSRPSPLPVNTADLCAENEVDSLVAICAAVDFYQVGFKFSKPGRVGKVAGGKHIYALGLGPNCKIFQSKVFAASVGITRVNVKVGGECVRCGHGFSLA